MKYIVICSIGVALIVSGILFYVYGGRNLGQTVISGGALHPLGKTAAYKIYFPNSKEDPDALFCNKVYYTYRTVQLPLDTSEIPNDRLPATNLGQLIYFVVSGLISGPTEDEKQKGFFSSINSETKINQIMVENGLASIDFSDDIEKGLGGSCRVGAIRAQIEQSVEQFPEINKVIISVNGRVGDVLQP